MVFNDKRDYKSPATSKSDYKPEMRLVKDNSDVCLPEFIFVTWISSRVLSDTETLSYASHSKRDSP